MSGTRRRSMPYLLAALALAWAATAVGACDEEPEPEASSCEPIDSSWCEGTVITACHREPYYFYNYRLEAGVDCADYGAVCVDGVGSDNNPRAFCAVPDETCVQVGERYCVSDRLVGICQESGEYAMFGCGARRCYLEQYGAALCLFAEGPCGSEAQQCWDQDEHFYIVCIDGHWDSLRQCPTGEVCVEDTDGHGECAPAGD